jgi:translation initiation factor 3 subunit C
MVTDRTGVCCLAQDTIKDKEVECQVLFNRTMAQVGMAAFRMGYITEAHTVLANLFSRKALLRELLAQVRCRHVPPPIAVSLSWPC